MDQRIPPPLHPLLQEYTRRIDQDFHGRVVAIYLEGSIALGGFHPRLSDVDFVAVLSSPASSDDHEKLRGIHADINKQYPAWEMSGMYFQAADLGCLDQTSEPFLNYHDGNLTWSSQFELSSVTWWILKNRGIPVFGSLPQTFDFSVDIDHLIRVQRKNLNTYWASWTTRLDGILALFSDWGIQWTVLGVLRQFYTIREHAIVSKIQAGEYAIARMPTRWHRIIQEAIALRGESKLSYYHSRLKRAADAFRFLKYVIQSCNEYPDSG